MSMDRCTTCNRQIDTDVDVECYEGADPYKAVCSTCRDDEFWKQVDYARERAKDRKAGLEP